MATALLNERIMRGTKEISVLPARFALGSSMLYHGYSKLKPEGLKQTAGFFEQLGFKPGRPFVIATGLTELFAGISAILGIGTRLAALGVLVTQAVAITKVHKPQGFDVTNKGFEYNLALMGIALGLLLAGPGKVSTHEGLERLVEGRGAKRLLRRARPSPLLRALKLLK